MTIAAFQRCLGCCPGVVLGLVFAGCLPQNADSADAGANNSGTPTTGLCVSRPTPCGGDVTGTWTVQSICALSNPVDQVNARFASYPDCAGACLAASMRASGTKTYDSGSVSSSETFQLTETLSFTSACFSEVTSASLADDTCQAAGTELGSATCNLMFTGCTCQVNQTIATTAVSYLVSNTTLTEAESGSLQGTSMEYCVIGSTMTQRRSLAPGADYIITYTRR